jgi:potassium efflux system protein
MTIQASPRREAKALIRAAAAIIWLIACASSWSQTVIPSVPSDGSVSLEQIESAIAAVEVQEGFDDETRGRVVDQLRDAQAQIQNRLSAEAAAAAFAQAINTAPDQTAEIEQQLVGEPGLQPTDESVGLRDDMSLADLEQVLARESAALTGVESSLSELESEIGLQEDRPAQARQRIDELRTNRDELNQQIDAEPPPSESPILTDARRLATNLRRDAQSAAIARLEQELLSHGVRVALLNARRDLTERSVTEQRARVALLQSRVNEARQAAAVTAAQVAELTELEAADKHPVVRSLAEGNAELTRELPTIAEDIQAATQAIEEVEAKARQIEQSLARSRQRLEIGGVSRVIGQLFVEERRNLPQVGEYRTQVRTRRTVLANIGLAQVRIDEQRRDLTPLDAAVAERMAGVEADEASPEELEDIESEVRLLLRDRRDLLNQAAGTYTTYLRALSDLDVAQRRLLAAADEYKQFLDQNLLWIPSTTFLGIGTLRDLGPAVRWAFSPESWINVGRSVLQAPRSNPLGAALTVLLVAGLFAAGRSLARQLERINAKVGVLSTDHIGLTLAALAIVAVRALPIPALLAVLGWAVSVGSTSSDFLLGVSNSLMTLAPFLYNVTLYWLLTARNGVAEVHFGWQAPVLSMVQRQLRRFAIIGVPLLFVAVLGYTASVPAYRESLSRIAFILVMALLSSVAYRIARAIADEALDRDKGEKERFAGEVRGVWIVLLAGAPLVLGLMALVGYLYTAAILTGRLIDTFWLILSLSIVNLVALRWLALARRKIAWQLAKEKRAKSAARPAEGEPESESRLEGQAPVIKHKPIDLDAVDQQTRRLMRAGLISVGVLGTWAIWNEVLPALNVFEQVSLWSQTTLVDGQETIVPVTLADLLLAAVIILVTVVASRNLPGLMEIAVLQRLTLQPGSRYTINTLVRYIVVIIGTTFVLSIVGWDWSQIQWLVAALSVGLGFGLQEIVANFVSGLVILFERPVRVGDTVTVGELTGTVSQVRIRATTIRDWDRKEIVVPNKSFITEQVVNWTLTDPITRVVVPVGIAYGSDVKLAHRVMEETLREMPLVLDDPAPQVYFTGFGDSSLNFDLFVYSRQLSDRLPLTHAVHEDILEALRQHDIEIPFPQRDLHLRSVDDSIQGIGRKNEGPRENP